MESGVENVSQCCLVSNRHNCDLNLEPEESVVFPQFSPDSPKLLPESLHALVARRMYQQHMVDFN